MATPSDLQNSISSIQWTNGRGLVAGAMLLGVMTIVLGIFGTLGTWNSSGIFTPNIPAGTIMGAQLQAGAAAANLGATPTTGDVSGSLLGPLTVNKLGGQTPAAVATSGSYNDLFDTPTIPAPLAYVTGIRKGAGAGSLDTAVAPGTNYLAPNGSGSALMGISAVGKSGNSSDNIIAAADAGLGTVSRGYASHWGDHLSVLDFGAKCDGSTDDTNALKAAFAHSTYDISLPPGTCIFRTAPLVINRTQAAIHGAGAYATTLRYAGAATNTDLIQVGTGTRVINGNTSSGHETIEGFSVTSATKMAGGSAIHENNTGFVDYNNIELNDSNLWDGFWFDQIDKTHVNNFLVTTQNDCIRWSGNGAESSPATGPQYDLWVKGGKLTACHAGLHAGGGFDGAAFDDLQDTVVDYNLLVDLGIPDANGNTHPNQEIWLGSQVVFAFANWNNIEVNDPKCQPNIFCNISLAGYITVAGNGTLVSGGGGASAPAGIASGSYAGQAAPANAGDGVHIKAYPGGQVHLMTPYMQGFSNAAVLTEDNSSELYFAPSADVKFAKYGIYATAPSWSLVKSFPQLSSVTTNYTNVANAPVSCAAGSVSLSTFVVSNGIVTHC